MTHARTLLSICGSAIIAGCSTAVDPPASRGPVATPSIVASASAMTAASGSSTAPTGVIPAARRVQPAAKIDLPGALEFSVADGGLSVRGADGVFAIDPEANVATSQVKIPDHFSAFVAAGGAVWVTYLEKSEVRGYPVGSGGKPITIPVGLHPTSISWADGSVWASNLFGLFITRIDPATGETLVEWGPDIFTATPTSRPSERSVWWSAFDRQRAIAIDGETNELAANVGLPIAPCRITPIGDHVLATGCPDDSVVRFTSSDTKAARTIDLPAPPGRIVELGGRLWTTLTTDVAERPRSLVALDGDTLRPVDAVEVPSGIADLASAYGSLWVSTQDGILRFAGSDVADT